jgi:hypothetical protein
MGSYFGSSAHPAITKLPATSDHGRPKGIVKKERRVDFKGTV